MSGLAISVVGGNLVFFYGAPIVHAFSDVAVYVVAWVGVELPAVWGSTFFSTVWPRFFSNASRQASFVTALMPFVTVCSLSVTLSLVISMCYLNFISA